MAGQLLIRTVRVRLCRIYQSLGDEEHQEENARAVQSLEEELELQCGACNLPLGFEADSLEALPCAHILHARWLSPFIRNAHVYIVYHVHSLNNTSVVTNVHLVYNSVTKINY